MDIYAQWNCPITSFHETGEKAYVGELPL